jgi:hypothetical protein
MPTIPEHEEVYAVNDVWDNEFRMLERMSCIEDSDMIDLGLYDLVWDQEFGSFAPCSIDEDLDNAPNIIVEADSQEASRNLRAILESFERNAHLSDDEDEDEEDLLSGKDGAVVIRANSSAYSGYSRTCEILGSVESDEEDEYDEEHKEINTVSDADLVEIHHQESSSCRAALTSGESSSNENVADVMRRAISAAGTSSIHQKQKVC